MTKGLIVGHNVLTGAQRSALERWYRKQNGLIWDKALKRYARNPTTGKLWTDDTVSNLANASPEITFLVTKTNLRAIRLIVHPEPKKQVEKLVGKETQTFYVEADVVKAVLEVLRKNGHMVRQ